MARLICIVGKLSRTSKFVPKQRWSHQQTTQSERDKLRTVISLVTVIRNLLCFLISQQTGRGRREIRMTGYDCATFKVKLYCLQACKWSLVKIQGKKQGLFYSNIGLRRAILQQYRANIGFMYKNRIYKYLEKPVIYISFIYLFLALICCWVHGLHIYTKQNQKNSKSQQQLSHSQAFYTIYGINSIRSPIRENQTFFVMFEMQGYTGQLWSFS